MLSLIATRNPCSGPLAAPGISVRAYHAPSGLSAGAGKELLRPVGAGGAVSAYNPLGAGVPRAERVVRRSRHTTEAPVAWGRRCVCEPGARCGRTTRRAGCPPE